MFDRDVSKALVIVRDFRVSEMSMDDSLESGDKFSAHADPAAITSLVHWNYALDLMSPADISRVVAKIPSDDRLTEVCSIILSPK